ncbi:MAG: NAD(P)H-dependent oxidoreductase [Actinobacteria bacterium]|nr:NAD(P)H-dependent oxidoreductase [Actinomycetota bacterium]
MQPGSTTKPKLGIVVASIREARRGGTIGRWTLERALVHGGFEAELLDLEGIDLPLATEPHHPSLGRYTQQKTREWSAAVDPLDAFVYVTPEYDHGMPATLKNAIDHLHKEWSYKPVGFVSYGGVAAGTRSVQMLKQVLGAVRAFPIFEGVAIGSVEELLPSGDESLRDDAPMRGAAAAMFDELVRVQAATASLRER